MPAKIKITRNDCQMIINELIKIFTDAELEKDFDFIAYGSYFNGWRDGQSDLDGILYFKRFLPEILSADKLEKAQSGLIDLYKKMPFLQKNNFFTDIFILDKFHGNDGRFIMFDKGFIDRLKTINRNYILVCGENFLNDLKPVYLRHQDEFDLAMQLHKIRNYLFFEIPRATVSHKLPDSVNDIVKFFKTLARTTTIVLNKPVNPVKEGFDFLSRQFPRIDYSPMYNLYEKTLDKKALAKYLKEWHQIDSCLFDRCWICFELTLEAIIKNFPPKSLKI